MANKQAQTFGNTGSTTVKTYMTAVQEQTSSGFGGRNIALPTIETVEGWMRDAIDSIVSDVKAINATAMDPYEWNTNASNADTHIDDLFPPLLAARIKNNPHVDDCFVVNYIDERIRDNTAAPWGQISGNDIKQVYVRYNKVYTVHTGVAGSFQKAYWQYGSAMNKSVLYEDGTCDNTSHISASSCVGSGATWTSNNGVTLAEKNEMDAKYAGNITALAT